MLVASASWSRPTVNPMLASSRLSGVPLIQPLQVRILITQPESDSNAESMTPNLGRRGIVRDIERVEGLVKDGLAPVGAVVVISNNDVYWKAPGRRYCGSINYRIHHGAVLSGTLARHPKNLAWTGHHSTLVGYYTAAWSP